MFKGNKIEQKLSQKLSISNKVVQSLKILNMGRFELEEQLESESESNPLLEVDINNNEVDWEKHFKNEKNSYMLDKNDAAYADDSEFDFENMTRSEDSLYDSLYAQICILKINERMKSICRYLIDSLDKDGYLRVSEDSIRRELEIDYDTLRGAIKVVQSLEPAGIGARNLSECIILQLHDYNIYDENLERMVQNDLNLIANSNVAQLSARYRMSKEKVVEYIGFIKSLDPKPASKYATDDIVYAYPDVLVEKVEGRYVARPYNEKRTKLGINNYYKNLLLTTDDEEAKKYITNKLDSAKKLMNDVDQRNSTVVNIANEIIRVQYDFFENDGDLKPLTMGEVADLLECHISTISRGVNDKYMLTDKGLYELKFFFAKAVGAEHNMSNLSVKDEIKLIIEAEDKKKPLSDKKIEDALRAKGIEVARRTVAKYREELGFLSSSKRKVV